MAKLSSKLTQIANLEHVLNEQDLLVLLATNDINQINHLLGKQLEAKSALGQQRRIRQAIVLLNKVMQGQEQQLKRAIERKYNLQNAQTIQDFLRFILGKKRTQQQQQQQRNLNGPIPNHFQTEFDCVFMNRTYHIVFDLVFNQRYNIYDLKYEISRSHQGIQLPDNELELWDEYVDNLLDIWYSGQGLQANLLQALINVANINFNPFNIPQRSFRTNAFIFIAGAGRYYSRHGFSDITSYNYQSDIQSMQDILDSLNDKGSQIVVEGNGIIHQIRSM